MGGIGKICITDLLSSLTICIFFFFFFFFLLEEFTILCSWTFFVVSDNISTIIGKEKLRCLFPNRGI